jgi:hypothetical protein
VEGNMLEEIYTGQILQATRIRLVVISDRQLAPEFAVFPSRITEPVNRQLRITDDKVVRNGNRAIAVVLLRGATRPWRVSAQLAVSQ